MRLIGILRTAGFALTRNTFIKLLLSFMLLNVVNVVLVFGLYYWKSESMMKEEIDKLSHKLLTQTQNISNYIYTSAVKGGYGLYYDDSIYAAMFSNDPLDIYDQNKLDTRMNRFIQMNPIVHSIYLYNIRLDTVISSLYPNAGTERFPDREMTEIVRNFDYTSPRIPYMLRRGMPGQPSENPTLSLIVTEPSSVADHVLGAMIINLDTRQLKNLIAGMADDPINHLFILLSDGQYVTSADTVPFDDGSLRFPYFDRIRARPEAGGTFVEQAGGKQYVIAYQKTNVESTGFIYVSVYPYTTLFKSLIEIRNLTLLGGSCLIAASFLLSLLLSRNIYFPIRSLMQLAAKQLKGASHIARAKDGDIATVSRVLDAVVKKNETLENFSRRTRRLLRDQFLHALLLGYRESRASLQQMAGEHPLEFSQSDCIRVAVYRIDHYREFANTHDSESRYLIRYAMLNIADETLEHRCRSVSVDMGADRIAVMVDQAELDEADILQALEEAQHNMMRFLKLSVTVGVGEVVRSLEEAAYAYESALAVTHRRIYCGPGALLSCESHASDVAGDYQRDKEKAILGELRLGRPRKVEEAVEQLLSSLEKHAARDLFAIVAQVTLNVMKAARELPGRSQPTSSIGYDGALDALSRMESREEIRDWMMAQFAPLWEEKQDDKNAKNAAVVERGIKYIEENYSRVDFSVTEAAEQLHYSVSHLNKLFGEATGLTVHEWINRTRLRKARELVEQSDMLIHDIAEASGFSSSNYFYFVFKKEFGMTPSAWRKLRDEEDPPGTES